MIKLQTPIHVLIISTYQFFDQKIMSQDFQVEINKILKEQEQKVQAARVQSQINLLAQKLHQLNIQQLSSQTRSYLQCAINNQINKTSTQNQKPIFNIKQVPHQKYTFINFSKNLNQKIIQPKINKEDNESNGNILKDQHLCSILTQLYIEQISKQSTLRSIQKQQNRSDNLNRINILQFLEKKGLNPQSIRRLLKNNIRRFLFYGKQIEIFKNMCSHQAENNCRICEALKPLHFQQKLALLNQYFPGDYEFLWGDFFPQLSCIFEHSQTQGNKKSQSFMK